MQHMQKKGGQNVRQKYFQHTDAKFKNTTSLLYHGHRAVALWRTPTTRRRRAVSKSTNDDERAPRAIDQFWGGDSERFRVHYLCRGTCLLFCIGNNLLIGGDVFFARARAASRAQKGRKKESERECQRSVCLWRFPWRCETEETMRRMKALLSLFSAFFLSLFSLSEKARDFQSIWMLASSLFFFPFSLSLHLSLIYVYIK